MECGDPFYKSILTKGKDVVGVAHLGRAPTPTSLGSDWLYHLSVEGCGCASALQTDHPHHWPKHSRVQLLDRLCKMHHDLKTYQGWGLWREKQTPFCGSRGPATPPWASAPAGHPSTAGTAPAQQAGARPAQHRAL